MMPIKIMRNTTAAATIPPIAPTERLWVVLLEESPFVSVEFALAPVGFVAVADAVDEALPLPFDDVFVADFVDVLVGEPLAHESSTDVLSDPHCHADHVGCSPGWSDTGSWEFVQVRY